MGSFGLTVDNLEAVGESEKRQSSIGYFEQKTKMWFFALVAGSRTAKGRLV